MNPADFRLLGDEVPISGWVISIVDWRMRPVLQAQKEDAQKVGRGIPCIAIVGDGAKEFLVEGTVKVVDTTKEVLVRFVWRRTDGALVGVMSVDTVFMGMGWEPFVDEFDDEDVDIVGKSIDGATQTQPINQIAGGRGPGEFLAEVRTHVARAVGVAYGLCKFVGYWDVVGNNVDGVVFQGTC